MLIHSISSVNNNKIQHSKSKQSFKARIVDNATMLEIAKKSDAQDWIPLFRGTLLLLQYVHPGRLLTFSKSKTGYRIINHIYGRDNNDDIIIDIKKGTHARTIFEQLQNFYSPLHRKLFKSSPQKTTKEYIKNTLGSVTAPYGFLVYPKPRTFI